MHAALQPMSPSNGSHFSKIYPDWHHPPGFCGFCGPGCCGCCGFWVGDWGLLGVGGCAAGGCEGAGFEGSGAEGWAGFDG
jgi:hypothetical protein